MRQRGHMEHEHGIELARCPYWTAIFFRPNYSDHGGESISNIRNAQVIENVETCGNHMFHVCCTKMHKVVLLFSVAMFQGLVWASYPRKVAYGRDGMILLTPIVSCRNRSLHYNDISQPGMRHYISIIQ